MRKGSIPLALLLVRINREGCAFPLNEQIFPPPCLPLLNAPEVRKGDCVDRGQGSEVTEMVVVDWYRSTAYFGYSFLIVIPHSGLRQSLKCQRSGRGNSNEPYLQYQFSPTKNYQSSLCEERGTDRRIDASEQAGNTQCLEYECYEAWAREQVQEAQILHYVKAVPGDYVDAGLLVVIEARREGSDRRQITQEPFLHSGQIPSQKCHQTCFPFPLPEAENSIFILGGLATKLSIKQPEPALLKVLSSVHFYPRSEERSNST